MSVIVTDTETLEAELPEEERVKEALAGDEPVILSPENPFVTLPRGLYHKGEWQSKAEVRELTGADEERLSKYKTEDEIFEALLALATVRVGTLDLEPLSIAERSAQLSKLLVNERMVLFLGIYRVTFGNDRPVEWVCNTCDQKNETQLLLTEDFQVNSPDDLVGPFKFTDSKGRVLEFRGVTGADLDGLNDNMTVPVRNSIVLSRVITKVDDNLVMDADSFVRNLSIKDRRNLLEQVESIQPTVNMVLEIPCSSCGKENTLAPTWADLFLS